MQKLLVLTFVVIAFFACQKKDQAPTETGTGTVSPAAPAAPADPAAAGDTSATASAEKTYTMNGKLVSRDAAKNEVTIDNEEVPGGVMAPMVMAYELRGAKVDALPPDGSKITSTLHEQEGKYWVTEVKPAQ